MSKKNFFLYKKWQRVLFASLLCAALFSALLTLTMMIIPSLMEYAYIPCTVTLIVVLYFILTLGVLSIQSMVLTVKQSIQARRARLRSNSDRTT